MSTLLHNVVLDRSVRAHGCVQRRLIATKVTHHAVVVALSAVECIVVVNFAEGRGARPERCECDTSRTSPARLGVGRPLPLPPPPIATVLEAP